MAVNISTPGRKTFAGVVGAAAAMAATTLVVQWEGTVQVGYRDLVGIATKCTGDTNNVVVGKRYTKEACAESLERQLVAHAEPVLRCTPGLRWRPYQLAAAVSLTYNIGTGVYWGSIAARLLPGASTWAWGVRGVPDVEPRGRSRHPGAGQSPPG